MDNPDADRRLLLALVLTMAVLFAWTTWFTPPPPPAPARPAAETTAALSGATQAAPAVSLEADEAIPDARIAVSTSDFRGTLDARDGALHGLTLEAFRSEPTVTPIWRWLPDRLLGDAGSWVPYAGGEEAQVLLGDEGSLVLAGAGSPGADVRYALADTAGGWQASRARADGLRVTKTYRPADGPYTLDVEVTFENQGSNSFDGVWVAVAERAHKQEDRFDNTILPVMHADGDVVHLEDPAEVLGAGRQEEQGPLRWFGLGNRYFLAVLLPEAGEGLRPVFDDLPDGRTGVYAIDPAPLAPGQSRTLRFRAYVGPKDLSVLERVGSELDDAVEFGFFGFFSKILLFLLEVFQKGVVNWGVAIILLTLLVKVLFFPLTHKAFVSGRRMQQLQPLLNELKEKYKDNPTQQQQEMMKLFQAHKVNPLGGCLPSLVQLPVWFGLYSVLIYSVELYNSQFLYLRDLTAADPYGVLPTLVAILFYLQQAMTPMTGLDPMQQKIMKFMPLIFAIFMYSFPSGLALYITVNSLLSIAQMWVINRSLPARPAPA